MNRLGICLVILVFLSGCVTPPPMGGTAEPPATVPVETTVPELPSATETLDPLKKSVAQLALEEHPAGAEMLSLIDRYWDYRSAAFAATLGCPSPEGVPAPETLPISAVVLEQSLARAKDLEWIRSDWGVDIHSTAVEHRVTDFLALSDTEAMLLLYEWNRFNWLDTDGEMSESGFGTEHILHLQRQEDGTLLLLLDDYDEGPAYTHTLERLSQSNMPSALKAARAEVSNAELCVVDTGHSYDAVVEEFMAV